MVQSHLVLCTLMKRSGKVIALSECTISIGRTRPTDTLVPSPPCPLVRVGQRDARLLTRK
jgi:hypothetical protein